MKLDEAKNTSPKKRRKLSKDEGVRLEKLEGIAHQSVCFTRKWGFY